MRIGRVIGTVVLSPKIAGMKPGKLVVLEALDSHALANLATGVGRASPMPESLVAFDELGAGMGEIVALSEGREAAVPFHPDSVPIDAYVAAIIDHLEIVDQQPAAAVA
jgi:microcompartment protein CcmK/EutM